MDTYALIPKILQDKHSHFGWVIVNGSIDGYEIKKFHLMPSGNGQLLLSVKAEIRKKIKKQAGDYVHVILYPDNEPLEIPEELLLCLQEDQDAQQFFHSLNENEQHNYVKWIYSAKTSTGKPPFSQFAPGPLYQAVTQITCGCSQGVEQHIIHIKASHLEHQLQSL